jgi:hypothetical protein
LKDLKNQHCNKLEGKRKKERRTTKTLAKRINDNHGTLLNICSHLEGMKVNEWVEKE